MKLKELLKQYKAIRNEMQIKADIYRRLEKTAMYNNVHFQMRNDVWKELINLNQEAYKIMFEYRSICGTSWYKFLFACGIIKKQNTFRFVDPSKNYGMFKCSQMLNLVTLRNK